MWGASSSRAAPLAEEHSPLAPAILPRLLLLAGESARPVGLIEQLLADKLGAHHSTHEVRQVLAKVKALAPTGRLGEARVISLEETGLLVDVYSTGEVSFWSREPLVKGAGPGALIGARAQVPWRTGANRSALEEHLQRAVSSGEEDRQVLQDYAGYSLLHWARPLRRALAVVGPEGSGAAPIMDYGGPQLALRPRVFREAEPPEAEPPGPRPLRNALTGGVGKHLPRGRSGGARPAPASERTGARGLPRGGILRGEHFSGSCSE